MVPDDLPRTRIESALDEARLLYVEGNAHKTALAVAHEVSSVYSSFLDHFVCALSAALL